MDDNFAVQKHSWYGVKRFEHCLRFSRQWTTYYTINCDSMDLRSNLHSNIWGQQRLLPPDALVCSLSFCSFTLCLYQITSKCVIEQDDSVWFKFSVFTAKIERIVLCAKGEFIVFIQFLCHMNRFPIGGKVKVWKLTNDLMKRLQFCWKLSFFFPLSLLLNVLIE